MADNLTQPDPNSHKDLAAQTGEAHEEQTRAAASALNTASFSPIIWTPRFIIIFFLLLAIGLSVASMLTRGELNNYYPVGWVLAAYATLNLIAWLFVSKYASASWVRIGSIFGCLWAILMGFTFTLNAFSINYSSVIVVHTTVAASSALLCSFICL